MASEAEVWACVKKDTSFRILVWGPGEGHKDYPMRVALREYLRTQFAVVDFSESIPLQGEASPGDWLYTLAVQERLHAARADVVFLIGTSPGAQLELILYGPLKGVGSKMLVLYPAEMTGRSFLLRVFMGIADNMPTGRVIKLPLFTDTIVMNLCMHEAKKAYRTKYPQGPPGLSSL